MTCPSSVALKAGKTCTRSGGGNPGLTRSWAERGAAARAAHHFQVVSGKPTYERFAQLCSEDIFVSITQGTYHCSRSRVFLKHWPLSCHLLFSDIEQCYSRLRGATSQYVIPAAIAAAMRALTAVFDVLPLLTVGIAAC